jgi:hypothetical protein
MMRTAILALLAILTLTPSLARAADQPYRLQIVLHVAGHRMLTDVLGDKLERELGEGLQAALGGMARVEVVREHKLLPKIEKLGLQEALQGWTERGDIKTHFILVDYADSYYQVRGLQHDGITGQTGPVVRTERTRDRDFIARLAALMIEKDFGIVGTVTESVGAGGTTAIQLRFGGEPDWSRWIHVDDVFALVSPDGEAVQSAYVQVTKVPKADDRQGICECKVANRYKLPDLKGYRAIKLGTTEGPIRIRLVRITPQNTVVRLEQQMTLYFRHSGFDGDALRDVTTQDTFDTARHGKAGVFHHLVFLTVKNGDQILAQTPIPLLGLPEVVVPINPDQKNDDPLRVLRESWERSVAEAYLLQTEQMRRLQNLGTQAEKRAEAMQLAKSALERTRADILQLRRARAKLLAEAQLDPGSPPPDLTVADGRLKKLIAGEPDLKGYLDELEKIDAEERNPDRAEDKARVEQAKLLVAQGELGRALEIYRAVRARGHVEIPEAKIKELEALWEPKNDEHKKARDFIYKEWAKLDTAGLARHWDEAKKAFEECKKVGDKLGARKMLDLAIPHGVRVDKERATVRVGVTPEDEIKLLNKVGADLKELVQEIDKFLKAGQ